MLEDLREFIITHPRETIIVVAIVAAILLLLGDELYAAFIAPTIDLLNGADG